MSSSPTPRLLVGLAATLITVAVFSLYALQQLDGLRQLQKNTIDRQRADSFQLLRIQNSLQALGLAMHDMSDANHGHPVGEWRRELARIREELESALQSASELHNRPDNHNLEKSLETLWRLLDMVVDYAESGQPEKARELILSSLEDRHHALSGAVGKLISANMDAEERAAKEVARIYDLVEPNLYLFIAAMLAGIAAIGLAVVHDNRRVFERVEAVSKQRSGLARRLIGAQEETFRSVSRELHDEFGQILTAIGALLRKIEKKQAQDPGLLRDLGEVKEIAQEALDKTRTLSQALHPSILDDYGLEKAIERYVPMFEKHTGIGTKLEREGTGEVPEDMAIHIYRVLQESLNNVAKHSKATAATVRLRFRDTRLSLEIEDNGVGMNGKSSGGGIGLVGMRERAEIINGEISVTDVPVGGTLVKLEVSLKDGDG